MQRGLYRPLVMPSHIQHNTTLRVKRFGHVNREEAGQLRGADRHTPSVSTPNVLALKFVGKRSWQDFCTKLSADHKAESEVFNAYQVSCLTYLKDVGSRMWWR